MTTGEAAKRLGVSGAYVRRLCAKGVFPATKLLGGWWRIDLRALKEWGRKDGIDVHYELLAAQWTE